MISPELQRASIEAALARDGAVIAPEHWLIELDVSGRGFGRKKVQQAISLVRDKVVERAYVWKYSRFGRNAAEAGVHIKAMEKVAGPKALVSSTEDVDARTAAGKFARGMLLEVDEFYSNVIGEQWKDAHAHRRRNGLPHNGNPRFGYIYHHTTVVRVCPQGCAKGECETGYFPDPAARTVAAGMYEAYNRGQSVLTIAVSLNNRGFLNMKDGLWTKRSVRKYMDTGFCAGLLRIHDPGCPCGSATACTRKVLVPGVHEPLIGEETWEEYLRQRKTRTAMPARNENPVYPLAGLPRCGRCGSPMHAHSQTHRGTKLPGYIYECSGYTQTRQCKGAWVARPRLEEAVLGWVQSVAADVTIAAAAATGVRRQRAAGDLDRKRLAAQAAQVESALMQLTLQLARKVIEEEEYTAARDELRADRERIGAALEAIPVVPAPRKPPAELAISLARDWDLLTVREKQLLLHQLLTRVEVHPGRKQHPQVRLVTTWGDVTVLDL